MHDLDLKEGCLHRALLISGVPADPKRWDLAKLRAADMSEDLALSEAGLADWEHAIDSDGEGSD